MKSAKIIFLSVVTVFVAAALNAYSYNYSNRPSFYLATDKSFGQRDIPYINLEGPAFSDFDIRVYRISDPEEFFLKNVKQRHVAEENRNAFGNPFVIFNKSFQKFKFDFRKIARSELNYKTRSHIKKAAGIEFTSPDDRRNPAIAALLEKYSLALTFSVPASGESWAYRRVPVPVKDSGVYLVEAVNGNNAGYTVIVKSNLVFITKQSDNETLVFAAKRDTGEPVSGAMLKIFSGETAEKIFSGKTSGDGTIMIKEKSRPKSLVVLKSGNDFALSDPNFYARSFYGEGGVRAFVYTDRPVYKPGDTVYFKGVVRDYNGSKYIKAEGSGTVDLLNDDGSVEAGGIDVKLSSDSGTFNGELKIPAKKNQRLGAYNLVFSYSGKRYSTELSVEAYKKPVFNVSISTDKKSYSKKDQVLIRLKAMYYFGSPVAGEKAHVQIFRKKKYDFSPVGSIPFFESASEYLGITETPSRDLVVDKVEMLDHDGSASIVFRPENIDEDYTYSVVCNVTASGFSSSSSALFSVNRSPYFIRMDRESMVYAPGDRADILITLVAFDKSLKGDELKGAVSGKKLNISLIKRSFRGIAHEGEKRVIENRSVTTDENGRARISLKVPESGHYLVSAETSGEDATFSETALWSSEKNDSISMPFRNLTMKPSRDIYSEGETAEVLIMSPVADGTVLVTIEGNKIIKKEVLAFKGNTLKYSMKITPDMSPNFTLSASQISGNELYTSQTKITAPPVKNFISLKVTPGKPEYRPGTEATLIIESMGSDGKGVASDVSVSVVDEAVYQIQEDRNPAITTFFFHPRINNVNTTSSSSYRFFGYSEELRLKLAYEKMRNKGYAAIKEEKQKARERFRDTCYWNATVKTDDSGRATVTFPLADNLTTWRVSAVAVTSDTKVGQARSSFVSKKEIMVTAGSPAYFVRGEDQKISSNITNLTKKSVDAEVKIDAENAIVTGAKSGNVSLKPGETRQVYFSLKGAIDRKASNAVVTLSAEGGGYYDSVREAVPLKLFGMEESEYKTVRFKTGDDKNRSELVFPSTGVDPVIEIRFSHGPTEALRQSIEYLAGYPYGCVEQTMSRFVPLLAAMQTGAVYPKLKDELPAMVEQGLRHLKSLQADDGGFGWFGGKESDPMMSAYVYRALAICKKLNRSSDIAIMGRLRYYLYRVIDKGALTPFSKAYIVESLSEGIKVEKSIVDSLYGSYREMNSFGKALVSLSLSKSGMKDRAAEVFRSVDISEFLSRGISEDKNLWEDDKIETASFLLLAAMAAGEKPESADKLADFILSSRRVYAWKNSRDTAAAVVALSAKISGQKQNADPASLTVNINGTPYKTFSVSPDELDRTKTVLSIPSEKIKAGTNIVEIEKRGGIDIYSSAMIKYLNSPPRFGYSDKGFSVRREYYNVRADKKRNITVDQTPSRSFSAGDLIMVRVNFTRSILADSFVMIEEPVIPGTSVVRNDSEYYSSYLKKGYLDRQLYFDRAMFFMRTPLPEAAFTYFLRAELPGSYRALPARVSSMYYPELYGGSVDDTIFIK